jgi:hypothetical protein
MRVNTTGGWRHRGPQYPRPERLIHHQHAWWGRWHPRLLVQGWQSHRRARPVILCQLGPLPPTHYGAWGGSTEGSMAPSPASPGVATPSPRSANPSPPTRSTPSPLTTAGGGVAVLCKIGLQKVRPHVPRCLRNPVLVSTTFHPSLP